MLEGKAFGSLDTMFIFPGEFVDQVPEKKQDNPMTQASTRFPELRNVN